MPYDPGRMTPLDWEDLEARRRERAQRSAGGSRDISPRARRFAGLLLLAALLAIVVYVVLGWAQVIVG